MGDKRRQGETMRDMWRQGRQDSVEGGETRGHKERSGHTPSTKAREGRHTIQQRETRRGTRGQGETRGKQNHREGGHTSRETLGKADTPSNTKAESLRTPKSSLFGDGRRQGTDKTGKADTTTQRDTRRETNEERQGANKTGEADTTTQGDIWTETNEGRQGTDKTGEADTTTQGDTWRETNEGRQGTDKTGEADTTTQGDTFRETHKGRQMKGDKAQTSPARGTPPLRETYEGRHNQGRQMNRDKAQTRPERRTPPVRETHEGRHMQGYWFFGSCFGSHDEAGLLAFEALQGFPRPARVWKGAVHRSAVRSNASSKFLQNYAGRRVRQPRTPNTSAERKFTNLIKLKQYRVKKTVSPSTPTCWRQAPSFRSRRNTISHRETKTQQANKQNKQEKEQDPGVDLSYVKLCDTAALVH